MNEETGTNLPPSKENHPPPSHRPKKIKILTDLPQLTKFEDFKALWEQLKCLHAEPLNIYRNLIPALIDYVEQDPSLRSVYLASLQEKAAASPDLLPYIEYVRLRSYEAFDLNSIQNDLYGGDYNCRLFRICSVMKELLELLISTFEYYLLSQKIQGGFRALSPFGKRIELLKGSRNYQNEFKVLESEKKSQAPPPPLPTTNQEKFFDFCKLKNDGTSCMLNQMGISFPIDQLSYKNQDVLVIPVLRSLCQPYKDDVKPILFNERENRCQLMPCFLTTKESFSNKRSILPLDPIKVSNAQIGKFFKMVNSSFDFLGCSSITLAITSLNYQVNFEVLAQDTKTDKLVFNLDPVEIQRGMPHKVNDETLRIDTSNFQKAQPFIENFFRHDGFLVIDPVAIIYGAKVQDSFESRFSADYVEGDKCYLSAYILASTLQAVFNQGYDEQLLKLQERTLKDKYSGLLPLFKKLLSSSKYDELNRKLTHHDDANKE